MSNTKATLILDASGAWTMERDSGDIASLTADQARTLAEQVREDGWAEQDDADDVKRVAAFVALMRDLDLHRDTRYEAEVIIPKGGAA